MAEDAILRARLEALKRNLHQVENISAWLKDGGNIGRRATQHAGLPAMYWREDLWAELDATIGKRARKLLFNLKEVSTKLAARKLGEAWEIYTRIHGESEEVFDECLEFIGGLAFRDKGFDRRICQVADELIRNCAFDSAVEWNSLTVLTLQERLGETLARIIRLRFPEWTIWTLPFTAHEFTYVVISRSKTLMELVQKAGRSFVNQNEELKAILNDVQLDYDAKRRAEKRFEQCAVNYLQKLLADAFATYTMGPAYACAALLLRFDPSATPRAEESNHPTDIKRAEVVLSMLRRMNDEATMLKPYDNIIKLLESEWAAVLKHAAGPVAMHAPGAANAQAAPHARWPEAMVNVDELVDKLFFEFRFEFRTSALYPPTDLENGWLQAQQWANQLNKYLENTTGDDLSFYINFTPASKLRDALNAAWLTRLFSKQPNLNAITDAALKLCSAIIRGSWEEGPPSAPADKVTSTSTGPAPSQKSFSKPQA